jgi:hypothetical protein
VCRLYPLGRHVRSDGTEWFSHTRPHPESAGELTDRGTVADYLEAQGAMPFLDAADDYFSWLCAARESLHDAAGSEESGHTRDVVHPAGNLLDMDATIAGYCRAQGMTEPTDIEHRKQLHLTILYEQIGTDRRRLK